MSMTSGIFSYNPGGSILVQRNQTLGNTAVQISLDAGRAGADLGRV
jgi:hypothetical protein